MRHISIVLLVVLLDILEAWAACPGCPASNFVPTVVVPPSAKNLNCSNSCDTGRKDAQDVGYFTQERGYFTQGRDGGLPHVG
ncbi:hypothetical protein NKW53_05920 [Acetobacter orientalis]|uniref:hypothetical protein n=1 Tax=Acetobacter orientalis TaxID=146474 RepID=UPI00209D2D94|nr:hypothetical protein [Acetobacter orientalis]MCP1215603.1 hypothetical protein [Acetobacter orientalis]MCP1217544.1 hypothetical protein [Acetobacter orientalis]